MNEDRTLPEDWFPGVVPENAVLDPEAYLETTYSFQLCRSHAPEAVRIERAASIYLGTMFDLGPRARVRIGRYALVNGARIICDDSISIGDFCLISWNVVLMDTYRMPRDRSARRTVLRELCGRHGRALEVDSPAQSIRIESNVWIGFDVCVLPGVTVGEGAVVGARSVVAASVPPYTVVAGNPAQPLRDLDPGEAKRLMEQETTRGSA